MSDFFDTLWSLPWHALQRRLAMGFDAQAPRHRSMSGPWQTRARSAEGGSWLSRVREPGCFDAPAGWHDAPAGR